MNILFLPKWYPNPDDPQLGIFIRKHAEAVAKKHSVLLIYAFGSENATSFFEQKKTIVNENFTESTLFYKKLKNTNILFRGINLGLYLLFSCYLILSNWQKIVKVDWIHLHVLGRNIVLAQWLHFWLKKPIAITEHSSMYVKGLFEKKPSWQQKYQKKIVRKAKFISVVTPVLSNKMNELGIEGNYQNVPNVVELADTSQVLPAKPSAFLFLTVADLIDATKNISGIIAAFLIFKEKNPTTAAQLWIIGDGEDRVMLEKLAQGEAEIQFLGRLPNEKVLPFMQIADAYITNSRSEMFSVATAEAVMAQTPVICSRCGGPEYFISEKMGIFVDIDQNDELMEAMQQIATGNFDFDAEKAAQEMKRKFSSEKISELFDQLYRADY